MIGESTRQPSAEDMRGTLPEGWSRVRLPEITEITMGQSPPGSTYNSKGQGLPFFQGKVDFGERYPTPRVWCTQPKKTANAGDVLISVRAPVGPTNVADRKCIIGRGLAALSPLAWIPTESGCPNAERNKSRFLALFQVNYCYLNGKLILY